MGYKELEFKLPDSSTMEDLEKAIKKSLKSENYKFTILKKSIDARKKPRIEWLYRVGVVSPVLAGGEPPVNPTVHPEKTRKSKKVVVVGTGPAGIFAADYLSLSGFQVTVLERGSPVELRRTKLDEWEEGGAFSTENNYSFGEGGAGTFSDGKLSSRTKSISPERNYIFKKFISVGGPGEIEYMTHPHIGSDNLYSMTRNLRKKLQAQGVEFLFHSKVIDLVIKEGKVAGAVTQNGEIGGEEFIFATGHSAYETYRMLIRRGIPFRSKNFALGFRAEHLQEMINFAQWGVKSLPGVKAAEYRLANQNENGNGVYTFCMCPGGKVVPAAAYDDINIVNGMSLYQRDSIWANAAVVTGVNLGQLLKREVSAAESLDWLEQIERSFQNPKAPFKAPAMTIHDFVHGEKGGKLPASSFCLGLEPSDLSVMLPEEIVKDLREGILIFNKKIKGYEDGLLLGLESKTSSPIQVERNPEEYWAGYRNLYVVGEGSGWSGGIVSSAADGLRVAQMIGKK